MESDLSVTCHCQWIYDEYTGQRYSYSSGCEIQLRTLNIERFSLYRPGCGILKWRKTNMNFRNGTYPCRFVCESKLNIDFNLQGIDMLEKWVLL